MHIAALFSNLTLNRASECIAPRVHCSFGEYKALPHTTCQEIAARFVKVILGHKSTPEIVINSCNSFAKGRMKLISGGNMEVVRNEFDEDAEKQI